jgi:hypothetical protein
MGRGFDTHYAFMVAEVAGDQMTFQAIARSGQVVDSGVITRRRRIDTKEVANATP